jgi:hypothetical protein
MGKSKLRGGAKAHRKRVQNRNLTLKNQQNAIQKLFNESIKAQMDKIKEMSQLSGDTSETQQ